MAETRRDPGDAFLKRSKRRLKRAIFGRTILVALLMIAQLLVILGLIFSTGEGATFFYSLLEFSAIPAVLHIANRPGDTSVKLTWVVLVLAVPIVGVCLYLFVRLDVGHRMINHRLEELTRETYRFMPRQNELMARLREEHPDLWSLGRYTTASGGFPVYENSDAVYYPLGDDVFPALLEALESAREFIFLEFFIVSPGVMWDTVLEVLQRKVKEGVEVRFLYDGTCALFDLPYSYPRELQKLGIQCKMFSPIRPMVSTLYNNRDHRKIVVVDGRIAFTGGFNLADEYINRKVRFGHWKDNAIKITGEAVRSFTLLFLQMWNVDRRREDYRPYLRSPAVTTEQQGGYILPYGDSPLDNEPVGEMVYMDILNRAERYVHIMTPYLIIDEKMTTAITYAAKRGVEVALILPHIPDKQYAFALAKTHYRELISAGVKIYEYTPGFVHAKTFVSDDKKAVVGTINLDYRSLALHFECAAYLYDVPAVMDIERDMQETMEKSCRITWHDVENVSFFTRLSGILLKLLAPLM